MGLFGSTKTYVSSTIYNMAGDINDRPNYLKTLVTSHVIQENGSKSFGSSLREGYLQGPGIKLRNFALWAEDNYPAVGVGQANLYSRPEIPAEAISLLVPRDSNQSVNIQRLEVKGADYAYWAEQWMLSNHPELIGSKWTSNYDESAGLLVVAMENGVSASFTPEGFDATKAYVYALYNLVTSPEVGEVIVGETKPGPFPDVAGWEIESTVASTQDVILTKVTKKTVSYSDRRPDEVTTKNEVSTPSYQYYRARLVRVEYQGSGGDTGGVDQLYSKRKTLYLSRNGLVSEENSDVTVRENLDDGKLVRVTRTEVRQEVLTVLETYRVDVQDVTRQSFSTARLLIYRVGSGGSPAVDAAVTDKNEDGFYFPFIPVRLDNVMVDGQHYGDVRTQNEKAYRKLTGSSKYGAEVANPLAENKSIKDIDYAYVMLGVSLNTRENSAKRYLFDFFDRLRLTQEIGTSDYASWRTKQNGFDSDSNSWLNWRSAQDDQSAEMFGQAMPGFGAAYSMPANEIRIRGSGTLATNMDIAVTWSGISRTAGVGKRKPGAKAGDCFVEYGGRDTYSPATYSNGSSLGALSIAADSLAIHHQVDDDNWVSLNIIGLLHRNYIYKGKYVEITAKEAMLDTDESGFLIPLHYETFKELSIVDATQLSTACVYMVINSYLVKKTGFFGSTFFKILLVVAVIAITVATGGTGSFSAGLLGSSAAVGAAIGVTGLAGLIVGAVANAVAAMVLSKIIAIGATALLGDKIGAIVAAVATIAAVAVGGGITNGQSLASSMGSLGSAQNILAMTSAVGNGVSGYIRAGALETSQKTEKLQTDYKSQSAEISRLFAENIGTDRARLDPLALIGDGGMANPEQLATFLGRTLLTGSEVAELTLGLLNNFTEITLSTDLDL